MQVCRSVTRPTNVPTSAVSSSVSAQYTVQAVDARNSADLLADIARSRSERSGLLRPSNSRLNDDQNKNRADFGRLTTVCLSVYQCQSCKNENLLCTKAANMYYSGRAVITLLSHIVRSQRWQSMTPMTSALPAAQRDCAIN